MTERTINLNNPGDLAAVKTFLASQGLDWDEGIDHTYVIEEDDRIIACASCHANVIKCVAVDPEYRERNLMGRLMTHLVAYLVSRDYTHYFCYTKPSNKALFESLGMCPVEATDDVLLLENRKNGLLTYLKQLNIQTRKYVAAHPNLRAPERIGAIVVNCNPFTRGHRYLIEQALCEVDLLHLFVLSGYQAFMPSCDRIALVKENVCDVDGVIVHEAGDYLVSPAVFPTYFIKDKVRAYEANCMLDIKIFAAHVAPSLGITKRFVGTEPFCAVTRRYNEHLKAELPKRGIELIELERYTLPDEDGTPRAVSASDVRRLALVGDLEAVQKLVPDPTLRYLKDHFGKDEASSQECDPDKDAGDLSDDPEEAGPLVSLEEVLKARDERAARQKALLERFSSTLISSTLNIVGPRKTSRRYRQVFDKEQAEILSALVHAGLHVCFHEELQQNTGYVGYTCVYEDAYNVKRLMVAIEDATEPGRLFDIDVISSAGEHISRTSLGFAPRKCLLCNQDAHLCARARSHSTEELLARTHEIIDKALGHHA